MADFAEPGISAWRPPDIGAGRPRCLPGHAGNPIVASGYGYGSKMPGNVLLVYEVSE